MALQCGIIGVSLSGKTTLFNCLSGVRAQSSQAAFSSNKSNIGQIRVPDNRLYELEKLVPTQKIVHTTVEIVDIPGLSKGGSNQFLAEIRNTDALIHVLRCFDNPLAPHPDGSINPVRDWETVEFELQLRDLESIEKKLARLSKAALAGDKNAKVAMETLEKVKKQLENFRPVRQMELSLDEMQHIADLSLLSAKPVIYVCNVDDSSAVTGNRWVEMVREAMGYHAKDLLVIAAELESEIAALDDPNDRAAFLEDAGLDEPGVNKMVRAAYTLLNLQTFFTVGPKEIRAWTIKKGMTAPEAAGVIHSDLERGFIRAEVMKYRDFVELRSENACREKGKLFIEGKKYIVEDGDILHIRFNV